MKIAIMLRHLDQYEGGVLIYTRNLLNELLKLNSGNEYFLIYRSEEFLGSYSHFDNVTELVLKVPSKLLWDQIGIPWIAAKHKFDVIFNPKFSIPLFFCKAKRAVVIHGSEWFAHPELYQWLDRLYFEHFIPMYYRKAEALISISRLTKSEVIKYAHIPEEKIYPVHHGFDDDKFQRITDTALLNKVKAKYQLPEKFLLWVGFIYPGKNIARLYEAFAAVKDSIPHQLIMVGDQRWSPEKFGATEKQLKSLGIADRVTFTGRVGHDELPVLYNLADLFVFPSLYEGFGIPLIEAMACGCPVLSSNTCAVPEVVEDAGVLIDPQQIEEISKGITDIVLNSDYHDELVEKGLRRALNFSWRKCAEQTLSVLENCAN